MIHPKKFRMDLETIPINYTDTSLNILGLIPFKLADRVGNIPLSIPAPSLDSAEVKHTAIVSIQSTPAHTSRENKIHFKQPLM